MNSLQGQSGTPKDRFVNTWYFNRPTAATNAELDVLAQAVATFYSIGSIGSQGTAFWSPFCRGPGQTVKIYEMGRPLHSPPSYEIAYTTGLAAADQHSAPEEIAVCLSFEAVPAPPINQARRRGRVFLGPLTTNIVGTGQTATSPSRPATQIADVYIFPALTTLIVSAVAGGFTWSVHSPTLNPELAAVPVARAWIDDAWDTQRRRGVAPTGKRYWVPSF